jgi:hypothetical protein
MPPEVLLKIDIASPSAKVASGIVIEPPEPTCTYSPTSAVVKVYEPVLVPTGGIFLYPTVDGKAVIALAPVKTVPVSSGNVTVLLDVTAAGAVNST